MSSPRVSLCSISILLLGLAVAGPLRAQNVYPTPYSFTTLAGAPHVSGISDGTGSGAHFSTPSSVVLDAAGNLYVADSINHSIRKVTPAGVVTTFAGVTGSSGSVNGTGNSAQFNRPNAITIDSAGNLYVADTNNSVIRMITPARVVTTFAGAIGSPGSADGNSATARFRGLAGIAADSAGNLYVADTGNQLIRKITPAGDVSTLAGTLNTAGTTNGFGSLARFSGPRGMAVDKSGTIYVTDVFNNSIRRITPAGDVTTLAGSAQGTSGSADGTGAAAGFFQPAGVGVDSAGTVYVADTANDIIRKITSTGVVTTIAGTAGQLGITDGLGAAARFESPYGVAISPTGVMYVVDAGGQTVRVGVALNAGKIPGITVPPLLPAGASVLEARSLAEQPGSGVLVGISGSYAVKPSGNGAQALVVPSFTNPQPYNLSYVVRLLANGQPDPVFTSAPGGDGTVNTVVVQTDGKILVGGTFTTFNGIFFRNLARLQADGKADATFLTGSGVDAQVNAIAVQADGKILVGGTFQNYQGITRPYLMRVSATGAVDTTFVPALNGLVDAIVVQPDGKILISGNFTSAGGAARNRIARLLATGAIDPSFDPGAGASDEVVALRLQSNGAIIAGGDFTTFAAQTRGRIVRLLSTGAVDPSFLSTATANATVISLGLELSGNVILGGAFTSVNGTTRNRLARLLPDGTLDPTFDPADGANKDVRTVLPRDDGTIFLGGLFDQYQSSSVNQVVAVAGTPMATTVIRAPQSIAVNSGATVRFVAEATGTALTYQWYKEGVAIPGATDPTLTLSGTSVSAQGRYTVKVTDGNGGAVNSDAILTINAIPIGLVSALTNVSVRTTLAAQQTLFVGFTMDGGAKSVLLRAVGPGLSAFGASGVMPDPRLSLYKDSTLVTSNDNWGGTPALNTTLSTAFASVGAFALTPGSLDAAFSSSVQGGHTAQVTGDTGGNVLVEAYDAGAGLSPRLTNVSARNRVGTGGDILIAGFYVNGSGPKTLLIRAVGPTLTTFGVTSPLADPKLEVYSGNTKISESNNWVSSLAPVFSSVGAFALTPGSKDAALTITLPPGSYTVQVSGADGGTGEALVELYELP